MNNLNKLKDPEQFDYSAMRETWKQACTDMVLGLIALASMFLLLVLICLYCI